MAYEDRSWMYPSGRGGRNDSRFLEGLEYFLACAPRNRNGKIRCPCRECNNCRWGTVDGVARHIHRRGFIEGYEVWYAHGEERPAYNTSGASSSQENPLPQMVVDDVEAGGNMFFDEEPSEQHEAPNPEASAYLQLLEAANAPVHAGSNKRLLQHIAQMLRGKVEHGLSQKGFDYFLQLQLDAMRSEDAANMPHSFYETTKYLQPLRLPSIEIDVCVNDCVLFYKQYEGHHRCPYCGESRWEINDNPSGSQTISRKKLWYFPLGPRLKRLFLCPEIAEKMTWHAKCKNVTDELIHPACGEAWKHFDRCHPDFAAEDRNPRVGMCTDGFNPFERASQHSIWPVFMTVYNLPPELCMTEPFIFMSLIISGPRGPGKDLDVMLQPLVDELELLFTQGTIAYDAHRKQNFIMRVALMWTISDFPGYGMLSSWSTHGRLSCPYCMEHTSAFWLQNGRKHCFFDCHRKFLRLDHPYRTNKSAFMKDKECHEVAPERRSGYEMYMEIIKLGSVRPGKGAPRPSLDGYGETHHWVQRSIFWQLPYWYTHLVRHNLDVMHVEKNVFDNVFYTLLDDPMKTKDNLNARKDLKMLTKRRALFPQKDRVSKAKATYTVDREQKQRIFQWVHSLRFPDGYASKISRCFNLHTLKVANMKSHDCHVFMQRLLTVAFADFLPPAIWGPLAELALFFRKICAPRLLASEMAVLQATIVETVCKLEKIFPPAFFDSMEHLMIHLPYEARVCGPVQYRWMYPFERRMHTLKQYIKNPKHPEGCIAEAYLHHEVTNFCSLYFEDDMEHRMNRQGRNAVSTISYPEEVISVFRASGRPLGKSRRRPLSPDECKTAHLYVLLNCDEVEPYLRQFDVQMCANLDDQQIAQVRANQFSTWFQQHIVRSGIGQSECMRSLARGPAPYAKCYNGYIVNGFRFHVEAHRSKGSCNSGVCVRGSSNGSDADQRNYYGTLQSVLELDYHGYSIFMFMCNWFDTATPAGVWTKPEYGLVEVNPNRQLQVNEPFILADQASQVYYTLSAGDHLRSRGQGRRGWKIVISTRARHVILGFSATPYTTSDENDQNNEPEREYQEDIVPRITYCPYASDDQDIPLATGEVEHVEEGENIISNTREVENEEGMEQFSSDEYSD